MKRVKALVTSLPEKKRYAELLTAVLSIPVLITVLLLNITSLKNTSTQSPEKAGAVAQSTTIMPTSPASKTFSPTLGETPAATPTITPTPKECKKEIGPIEITSPAEGEQLATDPICVDITRTGANYCGVVWSYRLNNGQWSEYFDKSICLYNLVPGSKTVEVKVKSLAGTDQTVLKRNFTVIGPTPFTTPSATDSAQSP